MRKLAIGLALASTALATPALARDGSFYAGIEGGVMLVEDARIDIYDNTDTRIADDIAAIKSKPGFDGDLIAGYDFGMIRLEGEISYKHANLDELEVADPTGIGF